MVVSKQHNNMLHHFFHLITHQQNKDANKLDNVQMLPLWMQAAAILAKKKSMHDLNYRLHLKYSHMCSAATSLPQLAEICHSYLTSATVHQHLPQLTNICHS